MKYTIVLILLQDSNSIVCFNDPTGRKPTLYVLDTCSDTSTDRYTNATQFVRIMKKMCGKVS